ncbi:MAG: substrate-binding domain-containing protein [Gammaproteobacteria bacterium]|nr:substrate-binding domain-containing protein [Gammaproteobacteria bacterium]
MQFSLWERLILAWIAWMRGQTGDTAVKVEANYSDSLSRQVADGILDLAVVYVPRNLPGLVVETLMDEALIMVSDRPRRVGPGWVEDYVFVDWGEEFRRRHGEAFPDMDTPAVSVGLGSLGLEYILQNGGSGYFPLRVVQPYIQDGKLQRVEGGPEMQRPAYMVYPEIGRNQETLELALDGLRDIASQWGQR